jgi:plastocyanin
MNTRNLPAIGIFWVAVLMGLFIIQGCGSSNKSTNPNPPGGGNPTHLVTIQNFAFSPATMTVSPGDTVTWRNSDSAPHTVTSDTGSELSSPTIGQGQTYQHVFANAGSFSYHCSIHSTMPHASVTVQ